MERSGPGFNWRSQAPKQAAVSLTSVGTGSEGTENRSRKMGGDSATVVSSRGARCHGSVKAQHRRLGEKRCRKRAVLESLALGRGVASFFLSEALTLGKGGSCRPARALKTLDYCPRAKHTIEST